MHGLLASILYLALLGLLAHPVGQALPRRWFHPDRRPWTPWRWEESGAARPGLEGHGTGHEPPHG